MLKSFTQPHYAVLPVSNKPTLTAPQHNIRWRMPAKVSAIHQMNVKEFFGIAHLSLQSVAKVHEELILVVSQFSLRVFARFLFATSLVFSPLMHCLDLMWGLGWQQAGSITIPPGHVV